MDCVFEFGRPHGPPELEHRENLVRRIIEDLIGSFTSAELYTAAGKIKLKEAMIESVNERLRTAKVRHVYFTAMFLSPG